MIFIICSMFPHDYPWIITAHPCSFPRTFGRRAGSNHLGSCISCRQWNHSIENGSDLTWTTIPPRSMVEWDPPGKFRGHFPGSYLQLATLAPSSPQKYLCCDCFLMLYLDHATLNLLPEVQQGIYPWQSRDTVLQGLSSGLTCDCKFPS